MKDQSALVLGMTLVLVLGLTSGTAINIISSTPDLEIGQSHMLLCKVDAEGTFTWQKNGEDLEDQDMVHTVDETSSQLRIAKATMDDAAVYTCLCELDTGSTIQNTLKIFVHEGPSFGATKEYHEFLIGQDAEVPCVVSGRPAVEVSWWRDQREIISHDGESVQHLQNNSLLIKGVRKQDAGTYYCKAKISGRPVLKKLPISVVVNVPPTVHLKEAEKKVMAGADTNISFQCLVEGQPAPNISWITPGGPDPRHQYNSDRSQLTVRAVSRADDGKYVCTASNKIGESTGTMVLHVSEAPGVFVSAEEAAVPLGGNVTLSCNVTGYPYPQLSWINKQSRKTVDSTSGRVQVRNGVLTIAEVAPSDGGLYSCVAVSSSGNASKDVAVYTQPGPPRDVSVSPKATSLVISLKSLPINGGRPITSFIVQLRRSPAENWAETVVPSSDTFTIDSLKPYTSYTVCLAALNSVGLGQFSTVQQVRTQGVQGEPDRPVLSSEEMKLDQNALSVPVVLLNSGSSPLLHYKIRYREEKEGAEWKEEQQPADRSVVALSDLTFGATYHMEVMAVNANGTSSPANLSFTAPEQAAAITKGGVVAIVLVIFLVLLIVVDATCCYTNRCGLLMTISTKVFGRRFHLEKRLEEGERTNGDLHLKGLDTPRGSINQPQTKEGKLNSEVTCDKAPLTKHEKHFGNGPTKDA